MQYCLHLTLIVCWLLRTDGSWMSCYSYVVVQGLVKHIDNISDKDIPDVHIPTGTPMVYELDQDMKATHHYHLEEDSEE